jgi:hypothetical protein
MELDVSDFIDKLITCCLIGAVCFSSLFAVLAAMALGGLSAKFF